jgi:exopolysaccharide biosynthesis polyprenyl glycosylphosphotransferase
MIKSRKSRQLLILLVDILILCGSLYLALLIRNGRLPSQNALREHFKYFSLIFVGWILVFYTAGLYILEARFDGGKFASRLMAASAISTLGAAVMFYLDQDVPITPKTVLLLFAVLASVLIWLWRYTFAKLAKSAPFRVAVAIIGYSPEAAILVRTMQENPYLGYCIAFLYDESNGFSNSGEEVLTTSQALADALASNQPELFIMPYSKPLALETRRLLFDMIGRGARFVSLPSFYEVVLRRIPVDEINETWFMEHFDLRGRKLYLFIKQILDIVLALTALILLMPVFIIIAVSVALESPGPVIFRQVRLGKCNKPFIILKFRTMKNNGADQSPTVVDDNRITRLGRLLRSSRLDELPQLWNILRGEMSFVGPRPERPELVTELARAIPFYMERSLVKPGITGWDQVSGEYHSPSTHDTFKKLQYDLYYIKNISLFLDVSISFKTILTVLSRSGQ